MQLILNSISTAAVNLLVFSAIPFLWWFFRHRKETSFFRWLGFIKPKLNGKWWTLVVFAIIYYFFYTFDFTRWIPQETMDYLENSGSVSVNAFAGIGAAAILPALIENFIANGVAEEILYRGFLCKLFCHKLGTVKGILLQAALFGLMHNALYLLAGLQVGLWYHTLMFLFTGMAALLLGWLNEKIYNGSILPSILLHGAGVNEALIAQMQEEIGQLKEINVDLSIKKAKEKPQQIEVEIAVEDGYSFEDISTLCQQAVGRMMERQKIGQGLFPALVCREIFTCEGVENCRVKLPAQDLYPLSGEIFILSDCKISRMAKQ